MNVPFFSVRRVVLATANPGKLREMREILAGHEIEVSEQAEFGIRPPNEDGDSYVANALIKARHASAAAGLPAIADDSGIEVDALGGRPGVHSARFAGPAANDEANNDKLLDELAGTLELRRSARYRCAMVFVRDATDPSPIIAEASWEGHIGFVRRGRGGFGYDPLFVVGGHAYTAAEMTEADKNRVSHRGKAMAALAAKMKSAGW